jgi:hypothetical protein
MSRLQAIDRGERTAQTQAWEHGSSHASVAVG